MKKILIFSVIIFIVLLSLYLFFPEITVFTTLENIKASHEKWVVLYQQNPIKLISLFFIFNAIMAMLPVPGISMISLLGGALFGFLPGVIYSSIATAIGNLGGFFIARYFLQDYVYARYGDKIGLFQESFQIEGTMALFSFRLFPFIPSFVANFIMGVSPLRWWNFFWASWVGRIPMVLVYTWSGVQIAKVKSLDDILSPGIVIAFILLAMLPWVFRLVIKKFNQSNI
jgi:uncharacterized membrane protein YdjX (TVP38/TMEM64 family)